jgi:hypothetical protein
MRIKKIRGKKGKKRALEAEWRLTIGLRHGNKQKNEKEEAEKEVQKFKIERWKEAKVRGSCGVISFDLSSLGVQWCFTP